VAPNKFLAKIASDWRKPDGLFVIRPHEVETFLEPLEVGIVPGVGKVMKARLEAIGIHTVGDLRRAGHDALAQHFGHWGERLYELSLGIDERAVHTDLPTQSISAEDTFERDLRLDELEGAIRALAAKAWRAAEREIERVGRTVVLKLKTGDFRILTRSLTPSTPPASGEQLADYALGLRERVALPPTTRYRLAGVGLANFVARADPRAQAGLFDAEP
jgi:DNA polymerase-4